MSQMSYDFQRHMWYESDVTINGQEVQHIAVRDSGLMMGVQQVHEWYFYTVRIGDAVLYRGSETQIWDTLYYYGVPGERWWPIDAPDPACPEFLGMLEIVDTCSIQMDGVTKRIWEVASLDADGSVSPGTNKDLVEGIGMVPFHPTPYFCDMIVEWYLVTFVSYSDHELAFDAWPDWSDCMDISTSMPEVKGEQLPVIYPNPSTNGFHLSGSFGPGTEVSLSDAAGRVVLTRSLIGSKAFMEVLELPAGLYNVRIIQQEKGVHVGSWIRMD